MLIVRPKVTDLTFRLFGRSVHPELFQVFAHRSIQRQDYRLDVNITSAGHVVTWRNQYATLTEVACSTLQPLPAQRELFAQNFGDGTRRRLNWLDQVDYCSDFSLEHSTPYTFANIQSQLLAASEYEGLVFQFHSSGRMSFGGVSYIDIQARLQSVRVRAFHTFPDTSIVVKSDTHFSLVHRVCH